MILFLRGVFSYPVPGIIHSSIQNCHVHFHHFVSYNVTLFSISPVLFCRELPPGGEWQRQRKHSHALSAPAGPGAAHVPWPHPLHQQHPADGGRPGPVPRGRGHAPARRARLHALLHPLHAAPQLAEPRGQCLPAPLLYMAGRRVGR